MKSPSSHFKNAICINYSSCMKKAYSIESILLKFQVIDLIVQ